MELSIKEQLADMSGVVGGNPGRLMLEAAEEIDRLSKDADRYKWLRYRFIGVDFDWEGPLVLMFGEPMELPICNDCDTLIDGAMNKVPNA